MSWSPVIGLLGSDIPPRGLEYGLYKPGSNPGVVVYYFGEDPYGIPAFCRFVDPNTQQVVVCPIQGESYYLEVKSPPTGYNTPNEYLVIIYQDDDPGGPLPPGPSFSFSKDRNVTNYGTYFKVLYPTTDGFFMFEITRKDHPDRITHVQMMMYDHSFDCNICGCPQGEICSDGICIPIEEPPEPEPPIPEPEPEEPCLGICGGKCYGTCPDQGQCQITSDGLEYECVYPNKKPVWTKWWFWSIIIGVIILIIILGIIFSSKNKHHKTESPKKK